MKYTTIILILLLVAVVNANECEELNEVIESYYAVSQKEDYQAYISLMDTEYIYAHLADEQGYKNYVTAAWEVYDTKDYSLEFHKCIFMDDEAIVFLNVESEIKSGNKEFDLQRNYAAILRNVGEWKIQFVTDMEIFDFHQRANYFLDYANETTPIVEEELNKSESIVEYSKTYEIEEESNFGIGLILLIGLLAAGYIFRKQILDLIKTKN